MYQVIQCYQVLKTKQRDGMSVSEVNGVKKNNDFYQLDEFTLK